MTAAAPCPALPHGIGPHEGRERALLLAGDKHIAYFSGHEPDWLSDFVAAFAGSAAFHTHSEGQAGRT